jgi:hypothetical protein
MSRVELLRARIAAEKRGDDPDEIKKTDPVSEKDFDKPSKFKDCHFCGQSTDEFKMHIVKVFKQTFGNTSKTCRIVGITRGRFYSWMEHDPEFKFKIENIRKRHEAQLNN